MLTRRPRSLLVADSSPGTHERRRGDCLRLRTCEEAWIEAALVETGTTGGQGKCLLGCRSYARAA
jgi:hypothetical protein